MEDNGGIQNGLELLRGAMEASYNYVRDRLSDFANFVGLTPANPTVPLAPPYTPPFTGGQCEGTNYTVAGNDIVSGGYTGSTSFSVNLVGKIGIPYSEGGTWYIPYQSGSNRLSRGGANWYGLGFSVIGVNITSVTPVGGGADPCGDLPNPNPSLPPQYGGGSGDSNDDEGDLEVVYAGLPVITAGGLLAALRALATAIAAIGDALEGIRKIGETLQKLLDLLDELLNGKKKDDKKKPENKKRLVGGWRECSSIDGYIALNKVPIGTKFAIPYRIQFLIQEFPPTASRILGVNSPSISIDSLPLFYLLFQDDSLGIASIKEIRTLNSANAIPPFAIGCYWNFRLNPQIRAKFRVFYEQEPEEEELPV